MPEAYIVYKELSETVTEKGYTRGFYRTQALADTAAALDDELHASTGAYEVYQIEPREGYFDETDGVSYAEPLSDDERLRPVVRNLHDRLITWEEELAHVGLGFPASTVMKGHDLLYQAHRFVYLIINDIIYDGVRTEVLTQTEIDDGKTAQVLEKLTVDQKIKFAEEMHEGSVDLTSPFAFLVAMKLAENVGAVPDINRPVGWVNAATGIRLSFAPTNEITPYLNKIDTEELGNDLSVFINYVTGSWIGIYTTTT